MKKHHYKTPTQPKAKSVITMCTGIIYTIVLAIYIFINTANAQTIIYTTNFGTVANVNPVGWTFNGIGMNISSNNPSSGYTGASGDVCLGEGNSGSTFINTSGNVQTSSPIGISEAILLVNTTGHSNVTVSFGMRKSSGTYNSNATYSFEWSTDGSSYTAIPYTESSAGNWGLVSGTGLTLPAGAANQPTLYLRWSFNRTGTGSNFKMDDVTISDNTVLPPANFAFSTDNQTILESIGTVTTNISITAANTNSSSIEVVIIPFGTALVGSDVTYTTQTITFPGNSTGTMPVTITINDDLLPEASEYFVIKLQNPVNATITGISEQTIFIRDNENSTPIGNNEVSMTFVSSFTNGAFASNSAEIVAHDPISQRLFVANSIGKKLDIIDLSNPANMAMLNSIDISSYGNINSVAVQNGIVACAIENSTPELNGYVVFFNTDGIFQKQVTVGALPDMITFNHAGTRVLTANEGQPNVGYTIDPEGSVSIIDISGGIASLSQSDVTNALFTAFNGQMASLKASGVRIYGPGSTVSQDMEPEYITISEDDMTAYVVLQENNAFGYVDLTTNTITDIKPLGFKDLNMPGMGLDATNSGSSVNIANWPIKGMYLPDAISHFNVGGIEYLITANEGDARADYGAANNEETSIGAASYTLDPTVFPHAAIMKTNANLGKLKCTNKLGDIDNDGDFDEIYTFGARSFSIWNATTGTLVYDSGDDLEQITANDPTYGAMFNCSNTNITKKDRSDDKGPEPEGVAIATIAGNVYAFVSMERVGGLMVFNLNNPSAPQFVQYINNRGLTGLTGDRGPEGIIYVSQQNSPTGKALVVLGNEISSSVSVYEIACPSVSVIATTASTAACVGNTLTITSSTISGASYAWYNGSTLLTGETSSVYNATVSGNYSVKLNGVGCTIPSNSVSVAFNILPTLSVSASSSTICSGELVTLNSTGAQTYSWTSGPIADTYSTSPTLSTTYTVTGTDVNGCSNSSTYNVNVNSTPVVTVSASSIVICAGDAIDLTTSGASTYTWSTGSNSITYSVSPVTNTTYTVTGIDMNGCSGMAAITITVNSIPTISTSASNVAICSGDATSLTASGASSYVWTSGTNTATYSVSPMTNTIYTVTGTDLNNCINTATISISVSTTPTVMALASNATLCAGETATLTASGASTYTWLPSASTSTNLVVTPGSNTTYSLLGIDNGCAGNTSITITINQLPSVLASTSNTLMCIGETVILTASSAASSYMWSNGAMTMSTSVSPTSTAVYTVTVSDGTCFASSSITQSVSLCTSLMEIDNSNNSIIIYPNPFNDFFDIKWDTNLSDTKESIIIVYNTLGEVVLNEKSYQSKAHIYTKDWKSETYYIKVNNAVSKIIKQD